MPAVGKFPRRILLLPKSLPPVQDLFGAYIVLNYKQKYKNILNTHLYMKGKMVTCKKWVNRKSKGAKIKMQEAFPALLSF